eukprot:COSAG06_NODE_56307_length_285_cov_1.064516_1_plen_55_part_10
MAVPVSPQTEPTMWNTLGKPPLFHDQSSLYVNAVHTAPAGHLSAASADAGLPRY